MLNNSRGQYKYRYLLLMYESDDLIDLLTESFNNKEVLKYVQGRI